MSSRKVIATSEAPAAIGPYSQGVVVEGGRTLYTSGQIALDPATGQVVGGGDVKLQTERVLDNLQAILVAAGMDFGNVVRCGIFLADLQDFGVVNELYGARFSAAPPARATVQVAGLPKGVLVEIDAIAVG
ncbi:MAG: RidA family protein [Deltaproteobacteria bacterium]|nr:RidA family protein [Deltaproteobacteria bacterium]MBK8236672.1 RidA family protein [Deltaproteobacteria bacterium]MBK8717702.1 RidA family protein [Deltaproteobacteria bacterium]MBP7288752.1 RidA family protein [Nannocystaceae bacterium]